MAELRPKLRAMAPLALAFALLTGVSFLPPDTAFEDIRALERLTVCAPRDMAPLVTRDKERPGFELALLEEAASRLGWRIAVTQNASVGREFNPGNWRITRATCRVILGGLRDNDWTRSLLELSRPYLRTNWVWVTRSDTTWPPREASFAPGVFALDRVALAKVLSEARVAVKPEQAPADLVATLERDPGASVITDALIAHSVFDQSQYKISPVPQTPVETGISLGFWKGDTTLRREMDAVLATMKADGTLAQIASDYGLTANLVD